MAQPAAASTLRSGLFLRYRPAKQTAGSLGFSLFLTLWSAFCHSWLLEVNASPSLTASSLEDYELKTRLLEDTLNIVDMEGR